MAISAPDVTSADIRVGHPVTFSVTDWVIVDPYYGERGRTYLPAPDVEPIKIVVSKPGDPSLISSDSITQILSQRTFTLPPDEPLRETLRSPRIQYARFVIRETHAGGQDDDWSAFLDARAGEIGFDPLTLRSKIDAWGHRGPTEYWTRYMRGLYAIYEGRNSDAVRWFAGGLNGTLGARDDEYFMALAYALLRRGDYEGAARFVSLAMEQQPSDPTYKVDRRMIQLMPHPRPTVKTDEERFRICRDVMSNVLSGDIRSVRDHFSSVLRFKISEDSLNKIIGDAIGSAGQFRRESSEYVSEVDNTWLYLTRWQFEFATVELRLYFDGSNNITEIWLTPQSADRTKKLEEQTKRILDLLKDLPKARAELRSQLDANLSEGFDEDQWSWLAPFSPSAPLADADSLVVEVPYYSSHATKLSLVLTFDPDFKLRNLTVTATK